MPIIAEYTYSDGSTERITYPAQIWKTSDKSVGKVIASEKEITKKVKVDLEVDTSVKEMGPNPYAKLIHMARAVDAWRIFPRLFLTVYIVLLYKCVIWYMNLGAPTMEQSGLISIVVGAGAAWFGLYTGTSKSKK